MAAGLVLVIILSLFSATNHGGSTLKLDSERLSLADLFGQPSSRVEQEDQTDSHQTIHTDKHFKQFWQNKRQLSEDQITAIAENKPRLSLVLENLGQRESITRTIHEKFPADVTLGLSPYTSNFNAIARDLHTKGFENWLMLKTLVAAENTDKGAAILSPVAGYNENIPMLNAQIKEKAYLTGIAIESASLLTESELLWAELSHEIFAEGFGIFDATKPSFPSSFYYFERSPAPYIKGAIVIDTNAPTEILKISLDNAINTIQTDRNLVITATQHNPASLDILAEWVNSLPAKGITLIPLSAQTTTQ